MVTRPADARTLDIRREDLGGPIARGLIAALDAEMRALYPEEGANHLRLDTDEVAPGRGTFLVAFRGGAPVGCGALRTVGDGAGEIKRMYVVPAARGSGLGSALLRALEAEARALGLGRVVLETGHRQPEALRLYQAAGFVSTDAFGEYVGSRLSVCMAKTL